jgi:tetratricopeptide (TPR) repeat protein
MRYQVQYAGKIRYAVKRPLGLNLIFMFILIFCQQSEADLSRTSVFLGKTIFVEYVPGNIPKDKIIRLRCRDIDTGNFFTVKLQPDPKSPEKWIAYFANNKQISSESATTIELLTDTKTPLFIFSESDTKSHHLILFDKESQWRAYSKTFSLPENLPAVEEIPSEKLPRKLPQKKSSPAVQVSDEQVYSWQDRGLNIEETLARWRESNLEKFSKTNAEVRQTQVNDAKKQAAEAVLQCKAGQYDKALGQIEKALELDPSNDNYMYQYAICLYKSKNYVKSLAAISLAEGADATSAERTYYIALIHLNQGNYIQAHREFIEVREEDDATFSASASYFAGVLEFQQQKYEAAQESLKYSREHDTNKSFDKSTEAMLAKIDEELKKNAKKQILKGSVLLGSSYDSNVLSVGKVSTATQISAFRGNMAANLTGTIIENSKKQLFGEFTFANTLSLDNKLQGSATLTAADPMLFYFGLVYKSQVKIAKRSYSFNLLPSYTATYLANEGTNKRLLLSSKGLAGGLTSSFVKNQDTEFKFNLSQDSSFLEASKSADRQSATRLGLGAIQNKPLSADGKNMLGGGLNLEFNSAAGVNYSYSKTSLILNYVFTPQSDWSSYFTVDYTSQNFARAERPRTDKILSTSLTLEVPRTPDSSLSGSFQYVNSSSQSAIYKYDKYIIALAWIRKASIWEK